MNTKKDELRHEAGPLLEALQDAGADTSKPKAIRCPFHDDQHPSAAVYCKDGIWRFKCQGNSCGVGGDVFDIRSELSGRSVADELRAEAPQAGTQPAQRQKPLRTFPSMDAVRHAISIEHGITVEQTYAYTNPTTGAADLVIFRCRTRDGKTFRQAHETSDGAFQLGASPKPWPLYNRARVAGADCIVVTEGEKCVHALHAIGVVATTSPGGAGKAPHADWAPLAGKQVVLWPDRDPPDKNGTRTGIAHMRAVAKLLGQLVPPARVSWLDPDLIEPALLDKGDAVDFLDRYSDCTHEQKRAAVEAVLSEAEPTGPSSEVGAVFEDAIAGRRVVVPWPWPKLTELSRALASGTVTLLVANPGATKSFMLLQAAAYWHEEGFKPALLELEDGRAYHLRRALAQRVGIAELTDDEWCQAHPQEARAYKDESDFLDRFGTTIHEPIGDKQQTSHSGLRRWQWRAGASSQWTR